jgi:anti-anti-sigma factor
MGDGLAVARIAGELELAGLAERERELTAAAAGERLLAIDLSAVTFVDSAGVSLLFELSWRLAAQGVLVAFVAPPECAARRLLDLVRMESHAPVRDSLAEAEQALLELAGRAGSMRRRPPEQAGRSS